MLLVGTMLAASFTSVSASKLEEAKDKRNEAQQNLNKVNKEIESLNQKQNALQAEMNAYDNELMSLLTDLTILEEDIMYKEAEIEQAEIDLIAAEEKEAKQYEDMKVRIRYMYENSNASLWTTLVSSGSFSDALNQAEYITDVYETDRDMLDEFQETVQEVTDLKARLDQERTELGELQARAAE